MLTCFHNNNRQQQQETGDPDPYVLFLLRQVKQKGVDNFETEQKNAHFWLGVQYPLNERTMHYQILYPVRNGIYDMTLQFENYDLPLL